MNSFVTHFINTVVEPKIKQNALKEIQSHKDSGHSLILATASFDFYAEQIGRRLGFNTIICTRSVWDDNNK